MKQYLLSALIVLMCSCEEQQKAYSEQEIQNKSLDELRILRNEIFARHGYIFKSDDLQNHFSEFDWYKPTKTDVNQFLTETDKANIELITKLEVKIKLQIAAQKEEEIKAKETNLLRKVDEEFGASELESNLIELIQYDLDSDGALDSIALYQLEAYKNDPGDFHRISIKLANGKSIDEFNLGIRGNRYQPKLNEVSSDLISIVKHGNTTLLMTFGWYFASDPPQLTIFDFSTGSPRRVFDLNFKIEDLLIEDNLILTGYRSYKEAGSSYEPILHELTLTNDEYRLKKRL